MARNYCNVVIINDTIIGAVIKSLELSAGNDIICAFGSCTSLRNTQVFYALLECRSITIEEVVMTLLNFREEIQKFKAINLMVLEEHFRLDG